MHHTSIGSHRHALGQDPLHVLIRCPRVDDQRQSSFLRRLDMHPQRPLLRLGAVGRVVIIKAGLADAHHFRMPRKLHKIDQRQGRAVCHAHRMQAHGKEDPGMGLGNRPHLRRVHRFGANRHHPPYPSLGSPGDDGLQLAIKIGKIQMAVAVDKFGGRHVIHSEAFCLQCGPNIPRGSGGVKPPGVCTRPASGQARQGRCRLVNLQKHIHEKCGRVKVHRLAATRPEPQRLR